MSDHPSALHASLVLVGPSPAGQQLTGLFLPAREGARGEVRLDGTSLPVQWGEASPALLDRFPDTPGADVARFRVLYPPELAGRAQLLVHDLDGQVHEVAACRVPPLPGPAERLPVAAVRDRVDELADRADADEGEHRRLHRSLAAAPVAARDCDWLEAVILLNVVFRVRARNTFANLQALREARGEPGSAEFGAFWSRCQQLLHPDTLTPHGFEPGLAVRDPDRVWTEVRDVAAAVRGLGSPAFLAAGSLLGLVRDGRPIPHDYDADLFVVVEGKDAEQAVTGLWELKERLADAGLLSEAHEREGHLHARVVSPSGLPVDLFPAWVDDDEVLHAWPTVPGTLPASVLLPGGTRTVAGVELPVPQDPERLLEANYGPGWRHPDPTFRFPWGEARARFRDYVRSSIARQRTSRWQGGTPAD